VFAFPLQVGAIRLGTFDLYRHRPGRLDSIELIDALLLADLAVAAVVKQAEVAERSGHDGLRPLTSYQDVNIATGMLAAGLKISLEDAFARLRGHAYSQNRSVLDVAHDVVSRRVHIEQLAE
jgi:AmiR/NasT family two-component response regulator